MKFKIPVTFTVSSMVEVEADDYDNAVAEAKAAGLPPEDTWLFIDGTFQVDLYEDYEVRDETGGWSVEEVNED